MIFAARRLERVARILRGRSDVSEYSGCLARFEEFMARKLERIHGDDEAASYAVARGLAAYRTAIETEIERQEETGAPVCRHSAKVYYPFRKDRP